MLWRIQHLAVSQQGYTSPADLGFIVLMGNAPEAILLHMDIGYTPKCQCSIILVGKTVMIIVRQTQIKIVGMPQSLLTLAKKRTNHYFLSIWISTAAVTCNRPAWSLKTLGRPDCTAGQLHPLVPSALIVFIQGTSINEFTRKIGGLYFYI